MDSRNPSDDQKRCQQAAEQAGEHAARVLGEFVSMASQFSRKVEEGLKEGFDKNRDYRSDAVVSGESDSDSTTSSANDHKSGTNTRGDYRFDSEWKQATEQLRGLGEVAGSAIEDFANSMKSSMDRDNSTGNQSGYQSSSRSGYQQHNGKDWSNRWPEQWLQQASELLSLRDPMEFFDKLKSYCDEHTVNDNGEGRVRRTALDEDASELYESHSATVGKESNHTTPATDSSRADVLGEIFARDTELDKLSEEQFQELQRFMKSNYQSALQLVRNKS